MNNREKKRQQTQIYLENFVKPVFDRLITELLASQPDNLVNKIINDQKKKIQWSVDWLQNKGQKLLYSNDKSQQKEKLSVQLHQLKFDSQDEEEDDEEEVEELVVTKKYAQKGRSSVSAEVYGSFNKKQAFKARVIPKEQQQISRIQQKLSGSFMFSALDEKEQKIVVDAMEEKIFQPGDYVIKQGDDGDELYVIDSGTLDCHKVFKKGDQPTYLKTYKAGESFGELSLLYNAPRAATIKATSKSVCFALDRATFNNIVKDASVKKREKFEQFLSKIDLLASMDPYERQQLCDGAKDIKYKAGETVITEGENGDKFYMISEGSLIAYKQESNGSQKEVFKYKSGDYFGELALIRQVPRQATVKAESDVHLVYLDFDTFKRLMGPIENILKRDSNRYDNYMRKLI